ncbi:MAG: hypothetical protein ACPGXK_06900 [Phycisphaerae bacterium]
MDRQLRLWEQLEIQDHDEAELAEADYREFVQRYIAGQVPDSPAGADELRRLINQLGRTPTDFQIAVEREQERLRLESLAAERPEFQERKRALFAEIATVESERQASAEQFQQQLEQLEIQKRNLQVKLSEIGQAEHKLRREYGKES